MILSCQNLSKSFGSDDIFSNISFQINEGDKIAIVGSNGAGKSTLMKIITKQLDPDSGSVVLAKNITVGYLAQYQDDTEPGSIYDIVYHAREDILEMKDRLTYLESQMAVKEGQALEDLLNDYHQLNGTFEHMGGYTYESEVNGVLRGLGFTEDDFEKNMSMLSGGQKTRVSLGKILVKKPDLLLLDEPINHLDLTSIQWLENYLSNYKKTVVIVAHDRYFLDKVVNKVLDIHMHEAHFYKGNYTAFVEQKDQIMKTMMREYEKQQEQIAHQQEVIDKLKQFNREKSIKRAESRQKALDKMDILDKPIEEHKKMKLQLDPDVTSGKDVLQLKNIAKAYDHLILFRDFSYVIQRGEHIAILGDNGTGKTTLLKIINEKLKADAGELALGSNVTIGYYDQEQQALSDNKTLFEEMQDTYPNLSNTKIRNVLAAFMFLGDDCYKLVGDLSGGERGRISLAKLMLSGANFLILDEPTNHLDMESKEILERALNSYSGTLLYVSHDRYFVNKTAHKILELSDGDFTEYLGNYDYYFEKKSQIITQEATVEILQENVSEAKQDWNLQKKRQSEIRRIENQIEKCETRISEIESLLAEIDAEFLKDDIATNSAKLNELSQKRSALETELEEKMNLWEQLSEELSI